MVLGGVPSCLTLAALVLDEVPVRLDDDEWRLSHGLVEAWSWTGGAIVTVGDLGFYACKDAWPWAEGTYNVYVGSDARRVLAALRNGTRRLEALT